MSSSSFNKSRITALFKKIEVENRFLIQYTLNILIYFAPNKTARLIYRGDPDPTDDASPTNSGAVVPRPTYVRMRSGPPCNAAQHSAGE